MALRLTATPSRVKKNRSTSTTSTPLRNSPFARSSRTKPSVRRVRKQQQQQQQQPEPSPAGIYPYDVRDLDLPDLGPSRYLAESAHVRDVLQAIRHIQDTMFAEMPTTRVGMNSVRIADVLNFRRALPPIVSTAHVHMLLDDPTAVEKEILRLVEEG
ncbi:hypothetical protein KEM56_005183, partial [Ascosphaera pollenicola]